MPHSVKRALPSAVTMALGKAVKQRPNFPALPSARAMALGKDFFFKRKNFFAECKSMALGKEFSKKKRKNSLPSAAEVALGKEAIRVDVGFFLPSADVTLGKGFTECPICGTRQRNLCQRVLCRLLFAECGTRQSLYRVYFGLCRLVTIHPVPVLPNR